MLLFFAVFTILMFPTVYKPENESNVAQLFASSAEVLADWGFVCPANKFSREWALQGSKVTKRQETFVSGHL